MRTRELSVSALALLSLSLAFAGCDPVSQPPGGTGGAASGGAPGSGGGSGGVPASGGVSASGGTFGSGGAPGSGGVPGSGGAPASGGADGSGGSTGGTSGGDEVAPSMGCGEPAPNDGNLTIDVDGLERAYILALPENYNPEKPYKLIFAWHPWGGSAQQVAGNGAGGYYGLRGASAGEAILVSPDGLDFGGMGKGWGNENGQDIAFLEAMMERFDAELCFDHNRVFSTGFSFGGMMSNAVACAGMARAVAPMAGNSMVTGCTNGTQPVAYFGFHGKQDSVVSIDGGRTARDVFVQRNGCGDAQPSESDWCEKAGSTYQPCECTTYEGCTEGYPVTWCEFTGNHMAAPSSAQTIWDFFAQF